MPGYKKHVSIAIATAPFVSFGAWVVSGRPHTLGAQDLDCLARIGVFMGGYVASALVMSPDMDVPSTVYRRWGPARLLWLPYQILVPHRSRWSHLALLGTVVRLFYLLVMLFLASGVGLLVANLFLGGFDSGPLPVTFWQICGMLLRPLGSRWFWLFLCGLAVSDVLTHVLPDWADSARRRTVRPVDEQRTGPQAQVLEGRR